MGEVGLSKGIVVDVKTLFYTTFNWLFTTFTYPSHPCPILCLLTAL